MAPWLGRGAISVSGGQTAGCRSGRPGGILAADANRAGSHASHATGKADGIIQNTGASLLRFPGNLGRHTRLLPGGERWASRTGATIPGEAIQQQGRAGWSACPAARQETRAEGRKFSTGTGLSADRGAGPLLERRARRLGRNPRRDGGLGRDGKRGGGATG